MKAAHKHKHRLTAAFRARHTKGNQRFHLSPLHTYLRQISRGRHTVKRIIHASNTHSAGPRTEQRLTAGWWLSRRSDASQSSLPSPCQSSEFIAATLGAIQTLVSYGDGGNFLLSAAGSLMKNAAYCTERSEVKSYVYGKGEFGIVLGLTCLPDCFIDVTCSCGGFPGYHLSIWSSY